MQNIVILGTGGTIAGQAARADDSVGYRAGALGVQALIDAVPPLQRWSLEAEQVASYFDGHAVAEVAEGTGEAAGQG